MQNEITGERVANAILMRYGYNGSCLVVEGASDQLLFDKFIDDKFCRIDIAFGKEKVIRAIDILNHNKYTRALGIIDKDFAQILSQSLEFSNLVTTDYHDIEISILRSPTFDYIIGVHSTATKLQAFASDKPNLVDYFFELAKPIGILKLVSDCHNLGLAFKPAAPGGKQLPVQDFIDKDTMTFFDDDTMITTVINYSRSRVPQLAQKELIWEKYSEAKK